MKSTTNSLTKIIAAGASVALLVLAAFAATVPAFAAEATPTEVLPVYQAISADEATAGAEVLPVYQGIDDALAPHAANATGVQPMGVEGAPLLHALDAFGGWAVPFAAVAAAMLIALGVFGIQMARTRKAN